MAKRVLYVATSLVVALTLSACGGVSGPPVAGGGVVPPAGTIWFGTGITGHDSNTISGIISQSNTIPMSFWWHRSTKYMKSCGVP